MRSCLWVFTKNQSDLEASTKLPTKSNREYGLTKTLMCCLFAETALRQERTKPKEVIWYNVFRPAAADHILRFSTRERLWLGHRVSLWLQSQLFNGFLFSTGRLQAWQGGHVHTEARSMTEHEVRMCMVDKTLLPLQVGTRNTSRWNLSSLSF